MQYYKIRVTRKESTYVVVGVENPEHLFHDPPRMTKEMLRKVQAQLEQYRHFTWTPNCNYELGEPEQLELRDALKLMHETTGCDGFTPYTPGVKDRACEGLKDHDECQCCDRLLQSRRKPARPCRKCYFCDYTQPETGSERWSCDVDGRDIPTANYYPGPENPCPQEQRIAELRRKK
jgi:hypothetical protein